jgi:hypothetical protein
LGTSLSSQTVQRQKITQTQQVGQLQRTLQRQEYKTPEILNPFKEQPKRKERGKKVQGIGQYKRLYPVLTGEEAIKLKRKLF